MKACDDQRVPRPATGKTPVRNARVGDEVWLPALAKAEVVGYTATDAVEAGLRWYASEPLPGAYDLTFANWPDAVTWLEPESAYRAFEAMDAELSEALGLFNSEYLLVATWLAATRHPRDPEQQARILAGHVLRKVLPEQAWADRYRDARHLCGTVLAILGRHLPIAAAP